MSIAMARRSIARRNRARPRIIPAIALGWNAAACPPPATLLRPDPSARNQYATGAALPCISRTISLPPRTACTTLGPRQPASAWRQPPRTVTLPIRTLHRRFPLAPWAAKVSHLRGVDLIGTPLSTSASARSSTSLVRGGAVSKLRTTERTPSNRARGTNCHQGSPIARQHAHVLSPINRTRLLDSKLSK